MSDRLSSQWSWLMQSWTIGLEASASFAQDLSIVVVLLTALSSPDWLAVEAVILYEQPY
jgi:hypothetical protein